jgi:DNA-binding NarL/FixJ family response regulator
VNFQIPFPAVHPNGLEAFLAAHEMRAAVIVMDVAMHRLNGIESARPIRAVDPTHAVRIIAHIGGPILKGT